MISSPAQLLIHFLRLIVVVAAAVVVIVVVIYKTNKTQKIKFGRGGDDNDVTTFVTN